MNITLSIDEETIMEARKAAKAMGKSLNEVIREDLQRFTRINRRKQDFIELKSLNGQGDSAGWKFNRDELHERS